MKVTPDIDFIDEVIVHCYVPLLKILLQVLVIYEKVNFDVNTYDGPYALFLDPVLAIVLFS